jgi:hypothetical protein
VLNSKKEELRREIARRERELEKLESLPDLDDIEDGAVLALFVTHGASEPYTYVAYRTVGKYYLTGKIAPNGVSAEALGEWLTSSGRRLVAAIQIGSVTTEAIGEQAAFNLGDALLTSLGNSENARRSRSSEVSDVVARDLFGEEY